MIFTSFQYILFLPIIVALFWVLPKKFRLPMLLIASYGFYMSCIPAFIALIVPITIFNYLWGKVLHGTVQGTNKVLSPKQSLGIGIAVNLLVLAVFKYANFFVQSLAGIIGLATKHQPDWAINIILPLGISFFTFEFIHYLFEIYRGNKPIDSFTLFALFAAFFPTQIAGPIKRYPDFVAQMQADQKLKLSYFDEGIPLIIVGMAKKLLLADNLAILVDMGLKNPSSYGAPELWLFAYAFAFQIYFDFSGYTDIGRGSAMLFGYHIPINFNMPYIAKNISEFWHRWHISLSSWLRDYLFIPLGGSRGGKWLTNRNLFLTMALGGLWHGASWNFVVWGVYHGLALIVHRQFVDYKEKMTQLKGLWESKFWNLFSIFITFQAVCVGWVFFRMENIGQAFLVVRRMVLFSPILARDEGHQFLILRQDLPVIVPVTLTMVAALLLLNLPVSACHEKGWLKSAPAPLKAAFCSLLLILIVTFMPDNSAPFIYFQF